MRKSKKYPAFDFGKLMMTRAVSDRVNASEDFRKFVVGCFDRYLRCDWGDLDASDTLLNNRSVIRGGRLLASYPDPQSRETIWIITKSDRSVTTILFRHEY